MRVSKARQTTAAACSAVTIAGKCPTRGCHACRVAGPVSHRISVRLLLPFPSLSGDPAEAWAARAPCPAHWAEPVGPSSSLSPGIWPMGWVDTSLSQEGCPQWPSTSHGTWHVCSIVTRLRSCGIWKQPLLPHWLCWPSTLVLVPEAPDVTVSDWGARAVGHFRDSGQAAAEQSAVSW